MNERTDFWTSFWSGPRLSCCLGASENQYDAEVAHVWRAHFAQLQERASILDVCTGNGAIALIAAEHSQEAERQFRIVAADAADIEPIARLGTVFPLLKDIAFLPRTPIEDLPFEAQSFDCVTSQFGIEYSDWRVTAPRLAEFLSVNGMLIVIAHQREGDVWRNASDELDDLRSGEAARLIGLLAEGREHDAYVLQRLQRLPRETSARLLSFASHTIEAAKYYPVSVIRAKFLELRDSLEAHAQRVEALVSAAWSRADVEEFLALVSTAGCVVDKCDVVQHSRYARYGWHVAVRRRG
jgi:ubiquinone/menaquinone biosynthesis C-methylase UbiE